jgi:hypothetical protein
MMLNKAAVEAMGLKNPLGMQMRYGPRAYTVTGITDNVVMSSPYRPGGPDDDVLRPGKCQLHKYTAQ